MAPLPASPALPVAGVVLSGGASSRMGSPKALLPTPGGLPLAARQALALHEAGCAPVCLVAGCHDAEIRAGLAPVAALEPVGLEILENRDWASGRATSVQRALRVVGTRAAAALLLPVDAAGIRAATLAAAVAAFRAAAALRDRPLRPTFGGRPGHALLVPASLFPAVLALPADARLDLWAAPIAAELPCDDPALLANCNTPSDWAAAGFSSTGRDVAL